jgi:heme-degrading monooxygenase HmoA
MSNGVVVTVTWSVKPELNERFVEFLGGMFSETRTHKGFRNIRLLRNDADPNQFLLLQEWDTTEDHRNYAQFRVDTGDTAKLLDMTASIPELGYWGLNPLAEA